MSHAIPITVVNGLIEGEVGDLLAELFWVTASGQLAKELGGIPVVNGNAVYDGPPLEPGLYWAIRIRRVATGEIVFRSGPLRRLPGPPSHVLTGQISLLVSRVGFGLTAHGSDGLVEIAEQELQNLPPPLEFRGLQLNGEAPDRYVVTLRARIRFGPIKVNFTRRRAFRLVGSTDPGRPSPPVLASPVGSGGSVPALIRPYAAVLDRLMKDAVERQLEAATRWLSTAELLRTNAGFGVQTVSVSSLGVIGFQNPEFTTAHLTLGAGAITGVVLPPIDTAREPIQP
jgi:hypothetical protein